MRKIHVVMRKEDIVPDKLTRAIAIVFDVLFATSSIATALCNGAKEVIPVFDKEEALQKAKELEPGTYVLAGEERGKPLEGFAFPTPLDMKEELVRDKTVVYTTTNGTVAIRKSERAKTTYTSSLVNGNAVADRILSAEGEESVVLICSGTQGLFGLEDFYAAGYLIDCLLKGNPGGFDLTDSAKAAHILYAQYPGSAEEALKDTGVGRFISRLGYEEATFFAAKKGSLPVVPRLVNGRLIRE